MPPAKPRIWPTLVFGAFFVPITWSTSKLLWSVLRSSGLVRGSGQIDPTTVFIVQGLVFELVCLGALFLVLHRNREPLQSRLSLARGRLSISLMPVIYFGCAGVAMLGGMLNLAATGLQSPRVQVVDETIRGATGGELFVILFMGTVMAAVSEELIFRGFIQTRLLRRFSPWWAITLSSVFFAVTHGDVRYALAVFPVGLWLGYVAYLAGSIWPGVICHFLHNSLVFLVTLGSSDPAKGAEATGAGEQLYAPTFAGMLFMGTLAALLVWWMSRILRKHQRKNGAAL